MAVAPPVIPYLSHGLGPASAYGGGKKKTSGPPFVWPGGYTVEGDFANAVAASGGNPFAGYSPSISIGGSTGTSVDDFRKLIEGSPEVRNAAGNLTGALGTIQTTLDDAIRRAIFSAGLGPSGAVIGGKALGTYNVTDEAGRTSLRPEDITAAQQNPYSERADIERGRTRGIESLLSMLAGRGMSRSGAASAGGARIGEGAARALSESERRLLDLIGGYEGEAAAGSVAARGTATEAYNAAAARIGADPSLGPVAPTDALLDEASGLYVTPDGRWFDRNRNPVPAPTPGQQAPYTPPLNAAGQTAYEAALTGGLSPYDFPGAPAVGAAPALEPGPPIDYWMPEGGYTAPPNVPVDGYQYPYYYGGDEGSVYAV